MTSDVNARADAEETATTACYVYGVLPQSQVPAEFGKLAAVGDPRAEVTSVRHGDVAAVVSEVPTGRPLGTPEDLRSHARVLNTLADEGAQVLPFRFGTVLKDADSVAEELLAGSHDRFLTALDRLRDSAQFTLQSEYEQDTVLREIVDERPEVARLREELAELPEDAGYYERIRLGELVSQAITEKRETDAEEIVRTLEPAAVSVVSKEAATQDGVADTSFLVADTSRAEFEDAAEELARRWHGRIRLRLLGPLPPYDFVSEAMGDGEEGA